MCGIAGMFMTPESGPVDPGVLRAMSATIRHRGPDDEGVWLSEDQSVGFVHRRLSIIDLSSNARQPLENEDGSIVIVFNGEIYNHAELRIELQGLGRRRWRTDHSDTEVILHAYQQWGRACLSRFRGMFAFALWDAREGEVWLVRDRVGVKPLYYSIGPKGVTFGSEIKALLVDPALKRGVDQEALFHYLSFLTTPAPMTLFEGISKLEAGSWVVIRSGRVVAECRYWDPWDNVEPMLGRSVDELGEAVLAELTTSVRLRKEGDVPIGVFLSGGLDSSANAVLFSEEEQGPLHTFSIGYKGDPASYGDELPAARAVAEQIGAEHHERRLGPEDLLQFLPRMVQLQDEPIADPVCVPLYYVSQLARDAGVKVCQVGEGADELFLGYPGWLRILRLQRAAGFPGARAAAWAVESAFGSTRLLRAWPREKLRRVAAGHPAFWGGAEAFTSEQKRRLLSPALRHAFCGFSSWEVIQRIHQDFLERAWEPSAENWMSYVDLRLRLPELLLMRVDKMSMGVSLEARVPFLDHRLIELALSIPSSQKLPRGEPKGLLRHAVRGVVPAASLSRPKQGFGVPLSEWFEGGLGDFARGVLRDFVKETDFLDAQEVDRILSTGRIHQAWYLMNLALWWNEYIR